MNLHAKGQIGLCTQSLLLPLLAQIALEIRQINLALYFYDNAIQTKRSTLLSRAASNGVDEFIGLWTIWRQ